MNSTIVSAGALTPFAVVARAAGLEEWALRKLEPEGFRSEENVRELGDTTHLTVAGIRALAEAVRTRGYAVRAHSLRVLADAQENTPSRALIVAAPKDGHPAWMDRADLA